MLNASFIAAVNHLLAGESWARDRLVPHAGKTALIRVESLAVAFAVGSAGTIEAPQAAGAAAPEEATLEVRLKPSSLAAAARGEETALKDAEIRGDAEFANALMFLANNLRWDFEEDLSRVIGDVAAHRLVSDARSVFAWAREAREKFAATLGEYLRDEAGMLAGPRHAESFVAEVERLRDDVARLEARLARLAAGRSRA